MKNLPLPQYRLLQLLVSTLFLFLGTLLPFKASAQCCPFTSCIPGYPENPSIICGPYDDLPGPYFVRVYLSNNHNNFYFGGNTFYLFRPDNFTGEKAMSAAISANYDLDEAMEADFADIRAVLETIRDVVDEEVPLESLPEDILDTLEINWGTDCSQAGALARNLLHRNGRDLLPDCSVNARPALSKATQIALPSNIGIYPNPADSEVRIDCSMMPEDAILVLTNLSNGETVWQLTPKLMPLIRIDTGHLAAGVYLLAAHTPNGRVAYEKLLIIH